MLCRIMGYGFEFKYFKGKDLVVAGAFSRSQTTNQNRSKSEKGIETTGQVNEDHSVSSHLSEMADKIKLPIMTASFSH